jgi:hypothetical protein
VGNNSGEAIAETGGEPFQAMSDPVKSVAGFQRYFTGLPAGDQDIIGLRQKIRRRIAKLDFKPLKKFLIAVRGGLIAR